MTEVTPSELKMLYSEIIVVAIIGVFLFFYNLSPIELSSSGNGTVSSASTSSSSSIPWSTTLVDKTLGLPVGYSAILVVSSIILIPMTIMNALTIARLAKDFVSQWV